MKKDIQQRLKDITDTTKRYGQVMGYDKQPVKEMSIREMVNAMRSLNENVPATVANNNPRSLTQAEIDREQEKMLNYFADDNVDIQFQKLDVYDGGVFWGGTIDGQLLFAYSVTPDEQNSGVDIKYLDGFDPADPDNDAVIKKVQAYYNDFYKYWRDNELQIDNALQ